MGKDFTFKKYKELIEFLINNNYKFYTVNDWISKTPDKGIILRHDVDRYPINSLQNSIIEKDFGIKSTYYFRITKNSLNTDIVKRISSMGHEIGYHYEDLSTARGDYDAAIKLFKKNLEILREIAEVRTISMHGKPISKTDNRNLWNKFNFKDSDVTGEAYLSINYEDIFYFTDTGRTWSDKGANIRDTVYTNKKYRISGTDSLITFIRENMPLKIALLTHPERWNDNMFLWHRYYLRDKISNTAKTIIKLTR
jgi:hypothetical protein